MRYLLFALLLLVVLSVHAQNFKADSLYRKCLELKVHSETQKEVTMQDYVQSDSLAVFLFVTTDCPVCLNYVDYIRQLSGDLEAKQIPFFLVFCGKNRFRELKRFRKRYDLSCDWVDDSHFMLAKYLEATTFPEIFIFNNQQKAVQYQGKIDNLFESVGKRRKIVSEYYFQNALNAILTGQENYQAYIPPVGCFIEIPE